MNMEMNTIEILPKFESSSSTTAEEMRTYIEAFADKLCTLLDIVIMDELTKEHTYGGVYFLGEPGSEYPLMWVGNLDSSSYFYRNVYIGATNKGKEQSVKPSSSSISNNSYCGYAINSNTNYMKYYKNEKITSFSIIDSFSNNVNYNFILLNASTENGNRKVFGNIYSGSIYFSYIPEFGETSQSIKSFPDYSSFVPYDKECIVGCSGIGSVKFPDFYFFSNKIKVNNGMLFTIGAEKYFAFYTSSSGMSPVIKIS